MNDEREEALQQSKEHAPAEHWHAQTGGKGHYTGHFLATSALAFAGCLWGTGFLFGKIAFREMTVSENVAFRFVCGSIALVPVLLRKSIPIRGNNLWLSVGQHHWSTPAIPGAIHGAAIDDSLARFAYRRHTTGAARAQFRALSA